MFKWANLFVFLLRFWAAAPFLISSGFSAITPRISSHPVVMIISFDGFRPDYLDKTETPNLHLVKSSGASVPYMQNQFLTYTFPNHHSISTGLYVESHGVVDNAFYDPLYGKKLSGFSNDPGFWNYSADPTATSCSITPLYTLNEQAGGGRYSGVMMWPGSGELWGEPQIRPKHLVKYNKSMEFEERIDKVISWMTDADYPANLVFLYCEEPDSEGHKYGPEGPEMIKKIQRMDNVTGYLLKQLDDAGIKDQVNLIFLSDHGMQEIKPYFQAKYLNVTDKAFYADGKGTPFLQIDPVNEEDTQKIFEDFKNSAKENHYTAYLKGDIPTLKPYWHYSDNRRIMDIILLAHAGYVFEGYVSKTYSTGAHGFDSNEPNMRSYFMAMGPLFKENSTHEPFENVDIYPLICHIMDITPKAHNGSFERVFPLLL